MLSDLAFYVELLMAGQLVGRPSEEGSAMGAHRDSVVQACDLVVCAPTA